MIGAMSFVDAQEHKCLSVQITSNPRLACIRIPQKYAVLQIKLEERASSARMRFYNVSIN